MREELARLRDEHRELARLRAENQRLAMALPPAEKLAQLRDDRAAVVRLRGEIEKTRDNLQRREQALAADDPAAPPAPLPPALVASIGIDVGGNLTRDGLVFEPAGLRQQLSALPRGSTFEIRVQLPKAEGNVPFDQVGQGVKRVADSAKAMAREFGLKMSLRTESPAR